MLFTVYPPVFLIGYVIASEKYTIFLHKNLELSLFSTIMVTFDMFYTFTYKKKTRRFFRRVFCIVKLNKYGIKMVAQLLALLALSH